AGARRRGRTSRHPARRRARRAAGLALTVTLFVDTSALVRRYIHGPGRALVRDAMAAAPAWCASALCRSETLLALHRLAVTPRQHERLWGRLRDDWDAFVVIPVDRKTT